MSSEISAVVPALNEGPHLRTTVERLEETLPTGSEIVVVDDGSEDGCADFLRSTPRRVTLITQPRGAHLGVAGARNRGARAAKGVVIIFCDAHIDVPRGWTAPLLDALQPAAAGAVAPVVSVMGAPSSKGFGLRWTDAGLGVEWLPWQASRPHPVPLLPGCCLAIRRDIFSAVDGFDEGLVRWGSEDAELSLRLWLLGYELALVPEVDVAHLFRPSHPYAIDWTTVIHNMLRVAFAHFSSERLARVVGRMKHYEQFDAALARLAVGDAQAARARWEARRLRTDDWYFERFGEIA